jgi:hypothetical protein
MGATEVWFEPGSEADQARLQRIVNEHYAHTYAEESLCIVLRHEAVGKRGAGQGWMAGGVRVLGQFVTVPPRFQCLMEVPWDVVILVNAEAWQDELDDPQRDALLDHQLYHGIQQAHDIAEFYPVLQRRGDWAPSIRGPLPDEDPNRDVMLVDRETGEVLEHAPKAAERKRARERMAAKTVT